MTHVVSYSRWMNSAFARRGFVALLSLFLALASTPELALAQNEEQGASEDAESQSDSMAEGRRLFGLGREAASDARWSDAYQHFRDSYAVSGFAGALLNMGIALRSIGRHREARDAFQHLIDQHGDTPFVDQAVQMRDEVAALIAVLRLRGLDPDVEYRLSLDGDELDLVVTEEVEVEVDAGQRAVIAEREGFERWAWEGRVRPGDQLLLEVNMEPLPEEGSSALRSPILWTIIGAVVVGGAVGLGVWLQRDAQLEPTFDQSISI